MLLRDSLPELITRESEGIFEWGVVSLLKVSLVAEWSTEDKWIHKIIGASASQIICQALNFQHLHQSYISNS